MENIQKNINTTSTDPVVLDPTEPLSPRQNNPIDSDVASMHQAASQREWVSVCNNGKINKDATQAILDTLDSTKGPIDCNTFIAAVNLHGACNMDESVWRAISQSGLVLDIIAALERECNIGPASIANTNIMYIGPNPPLILLCLDNQLFNILEAWIQLGIDIMSISYQNPQETDELENLLYPEGKSFFNFFTEKMTSNCFKGTPDTVLMDLHFCMKICALVNTEEDEVLLSYFLGDSIIYSCLQAAFEERNGDVALREYQNDTHLEGLANEHILSNIQSLIALLAIHRPNWQEDFSPIANEWTHNTEDDFDMEPHNPNDAAKRFLEKTLHFLAEAFKINKVKPAKR